MPAKKIQLLTKRDFSAILNDKVEFLGRNFIRYSKAFIYFIMPQILLMMAIVTYFIHEFIKVLAGIGSIRTMHTFDIQLISSSLAMVFVLVILFSIVYMMQNLLCYEYIFLYESKDDPSEITMEGLWQNIRDNILFMFTSYLGYLFVALIFAAVNAAFIYAVAMAVPVLGVLLIFGLFLVWIYLGIPISMFFIVRLRERLGIFESFARCFQLVKGNWWRTFGILIIVAISSYIMQAVVVAPLSIINTVASMHRIFQSPQDPTAMFTPLYGITQAVSMAVGVYFSAILCFTISINYYSLVESTDNISLQKEIENIGKTPDPEYKQEGEY